MSGWSIQQPDGTHRYHRFEDLLTTGFPSTDWINLPGGVYPIAQAQDDNGALWLLWSDGEQFQEPDPIRVCGLPVCHLAWLSVIGDLPDKDDHSAQVREGLIRVLVQSGRHMAAPQWMPGLEVQGRPTWCVTVGDQTLQRTIKNPQESSKV